MNKSNVTVTTSAKVQISSIKGYVPKEGTVITRAEGSPEITPGMRRLMKDKPLRWNR